MRNKFLLDVLDVFFYAFFLSGCFFTGAAFVEREHPVRAIAVACICFLVSVILANVYNKVKGE